MLQRLDRTAADVVCRLRPDRSDKTLKWETRRLSTLLERVIPHFRRYPMLSGKQHDFELFAVICTAKRDASHLSLGGLREIVRLAGQMNPSGTRVYQPEAILDLLVEMKA